MEESIYWSAGAKDWRVVGLTISSKTETNARWVQVRKNIICKCDQKHVCKVCLT